MNTLIARIAVGVFSLLTIAILLLAIFDDGGLLAVRERDAELEKMQNEIRRLEQENENLATEIDALNNDPAAIEKRAREGVGLVKPGEVILVRPQTPARK